MSSLQAGYLSGHPIHAAIEIGLNSLQLVSLLHGLVALSGSLAELTLQLGQPLLHSIHLGQGGGSSWNQNTTKVRIRTTTAEGEQSENLTFQLGDLGGLRIRSTLQAGKGLLAG